MNFFGFKDDPSTFFKKSKFTLVPSTKPEPFGRVAIESMYYSTPVIAANHGGLKEIVKDGFNGFLFEPNSIESFLECMNRVLALSEVDYNIMCQNCVTSFNKNFSETTYINKLLQIMDIK